MNLTMIPFKIRAAISNIVSSVLILLFSYTSVMKLIDHGNFKITLSQSKLLTTWAPVLAWIVPISEIAATFFLFMASTRLVGYLISFVLMFLFSFYVLCMLLFMRDLPCSCGGVIASMSWPQHLLFNIFFTLLSGYGYLVSKGDKQNEY